MKNCKLQFNRKSYGRIRDCYSLLAFCRRGVVIFVSIGILLSSKLNIIFLVNTYFKYPPIYNCGQDLVKVISAKVIISLNLNFGGLIVLILINVLVKVVISSVLVPRYNIYLGCVQCLWNFLFTQQYNKYLSHTNRVCTYLSIVISITCYVILIIIYYHFPFLCESRAIHLHETILTAINKIYLELVIADIDSKYFFYITTPYLILLYLTNMIPWALCNKYFNSKGVIRAKSTFSKNDKDIFLGIQEKSLLKDTNPVPVSKGLKTDFLLKNFTLINGKIVPIKVFYDLTNFYNIRISNKELFDCIGVYMIINLITNKCYVGSATSMTGRFNRRLNTHLNPELANSKLLTSNKYLQHSIQKYGINNFALAILQATPVTENMKLNLINNVINNEITYTLDSERAVCLSFRWQEQLYNGSPTGGYVDFKSLSLLDDQTKSVWLAKSKHSDETKALIGSYHKGKIESTETRRRKSVSATLSQINIVIMLDTVTNVETVFNNPTAAGKHFNITHSPITTRIKSGQLYKDRYLFRYKNPDFKRRIRKSKIENK